MIAHRMTEGVNNSSFLQEQIKLLIGDGARELVPAERPKGYRKGRDKRCFGNATGLAPDGRGKYVEGFAVDAELMSRRSP